jgi:UDPglucose 6-dehydrogenase
VGRVSNGMGLDGRIGSRFLNAATGWGGLCYPKDVSALRAAAREYGHETPLLDATVAVNEAQRRRAIEKLQRHLHTLRGRRVALLGLSFKPITDDLQGAPSVEIARAELAQSEGRRLRPRGGLGRDEAPAGPSGRVFDPYEALHGVHAVVVVTEWEEVRGLDPTKASFLMREPKLVVDGRNKLDPTFCREGGSCTQASGAPTEGPVKLGRW